MTFPQDWVHCHNGERIVVAWLGLEQFSMANGCEVSLLLPPGGGQFCPLCLCSTFSASAFLPEVKVSWGPSWMPPHSLGNGPPSHELWTSILPKSASLVCSAATEKLTLIMMLWNQIAESKFPLLHRNVVLKTLLIRTVSPERVQQEHLLIGVGWLAFPKRV